MEILSNLIQLFYPNVCLNCNNNVANKENLLCYKCVHDLPEINHVNEKDNEITTIFNGKVPIEAATSFLYFRKESITRELIHLLKYKNQQQIGVYLGEIFTETILENDFFIEIDCIIPVPLHQKRFKIRGYNQLTKFGEVLSKNLKVPFLENILLRVDSAQTQTLKNRFERFYNQNTKFSIEKPEIIEGKHILLIDDVITTGATLEVCCKELLTVQNVKVSIATIAYTE